MTQHARRLPFGAELVPGGVHFRVWAPKRSRVSVVMDDGVGGPLGAEPGGWFSGLVAGSGAGARYRFRLDDDKTPYPDPASRFQPEGSHGPSEVVDPAAFAWTDRAWRGVDPERVVAYELHIGTFTREGTWEAAARQLPALAELGVTVVEVMPVADFPGAFGWGYDGVNLFAPTRLYGRPDSFRHFVDRAHAAGVGVILDVVYNHLGPDGNYLACFSDDFTTDRYPNEWGDALNFDGPHSGPVRDFFASNAAYWIEEFHLDGLRLDATQQIFDSSGTHILAELVRRARAAANGRRIWIVGENEPQQVHLVDEYGLDALWNDDLHHAARVALTGRREAYYADYRGTPQEFVSAAKYHFLYQGQRYLWQKKRRGSPTFGAAPHVFVAFLENHDQIANSARGERLWRVTAPGRWRALTAYLLLAPATPMLFMGQEFAASAPFLYFADHKPELAALVAEGRKDFLAQFPSIGSMKETLAVPHDRATFERCKLDQRERETNAATIAFHRDLIRLRQTTPRHVDGAVLGPEAFALRFFAEAARERERLLLVNLGPELPLAPAPEPLLAPPPDRRWRLLWSSEEPRYGGSGSGPPETEEAGWRLPGHSAVLMEEHG